MTQHATQIVYLTYTLPSFVVFSFPPSAPVATVDSWEVRKSAQILGAFVGISRDRQLRPQWDVVSSWSDPRNNFVGELKALRRLCFS